MPQGGKPLSRFLCCYNRKEEFEVEPRQSNGNADYFNQSYNDERRGSAARSSPGLGKSEKPILFCVQECTYKRNESPQPDETTDLKVNETKKRADMITLATVNPYSGNSRSSSNVNNNNHHIMTITDVTDQYRDEDDGEQQEGSLVEYCRINHRENAKCQPKICLADKVVKTSLEQDNFAKTYVPSGRYSNTVSHSYNNYSNTRTMPKGDANDEEDVDLGRPCLKLNCKCTGFKPHPWRKVCVHCKCDRAEHEPATRNRNLTAYKRVGISPPPGMSSSTTTIRTIAGRSDLPGSVSHGYSWVPPGLTRNKVEEYMTQLPNHVVPRVNSNGEKFREKQLMLQLPRQDLSVAYCKHLVSNIERKFYEEFINARNEIALDIGFVCPSIPKQMECRKCRGVLEKNEMAVIAPKLGENSGWHPACFTCATCEQLLVDLTYCVKDGLIYCERHYAELHKPRCNACDELIFAGEYTKAMNKDWHSDHFCCWQCDNTLTGQRYILRDEHPYCIKCYEDVFANTCDECAKPIGIDSKDLSYKDKHWHEDCFLCNMCKISLVDKPFGSKNDRIFCSNCYDQAFATRCDGCGEIFRAGMKKMEYKGKQWHDKCFCCALCKTPIGTRSFIPKNDEVYCATCYEEKFATRCCKCKKVISTGGVTYKNEPWHRECFCCTNCNTSLAGQRFTSKDEKPYCANCYGELFAKRCNACVKPITGIGGAKFISFEDRHWHNDCFICAQCSTSLVGKGFITDGADILCPECAKARLMAANS